MEVHLIWAQDLNGGIGVSGKLPWHIKEDLKNFKALTLNSTIIMGRKTWDSLPIKPLPKRKNLVLSKTVQNDVKTYHSFQECFDDCKKQNLDKIFVIGGRSIYKLFFDYADFLHITNVSLDNPNINEFFPISNNQIKNTFKILLEKKLCNDAVYSCWQKNSY
tara:strand:- start:414 stop:899 length:486 start_codon:yes stop_codon:yes gene_type:complete